MATVGFNKPMREIFLLVARFLWIVRFVLLAVEPSAVVLCFATKPDPDSYKHSARYYDAHPNA